jgi:aminopeptidase S
VRSPAVQPARRPGWPALALTLLLLPVVSGCVSTTSDPASCAPAATSPVPSTPGEDRPGPPAANENPVPGLAEEVSAAGAMVHLRALQDIADRHGGNRASPSAGYDASVDHVVGVLRAAGFEVATPTYESDGCTLRNVVAQTRTGDPGSVVVVGAHLDSVADGPGIVDNGSGVAALLEIATRLGPSAPVRRAVRFAFFGSEEEGAVGSTAYVAGLSEDERGAVLLYLNVDMVASANAGYFVQGGKGGTRAESGPPGSAAVAAVLADELRKTGVQPETIEFVGDDETPFVEADIPSAGAENGDALEKSAEQARAWGGQADEEFDPCYHQACDDLGNVNQVVLDHYLRAIAGTTAHFAMSDGRRPE